MIDDRRDHKLTGNGETDGHGSSEPLDTEAADGHDQRSRKDTVVMKEKIRE